MRVKYPLALIAVVCAIAAALGNRLCNFSEASRAWERAKDTAEYQAYAAEFVQFNNHFHLDEKDGCYALSQDRVELMLVITHPDGGDYAVVEDVLSRVDSAKARCFQKAYRGLSTKIPPFVPFVLQMRFG